MAKYFKPLSVTWWASVVPLLTGIFIALERVHGQSELVASLDLMVGGIEPAVLINAGLVGIGLRGAQS